MNETVILYHANCIDGFTAAYCFWLKLGYRANYLAVKYGQPMPNVDRYQSVFIVDFSYDRQTLLDLSKRTKLTVLDHHKTAEEELKGLPFCKFDMNKSGARMAWDFLNPGADCPRAIQWVEDYDLWRFNLHETKAFNAGLSSHDFNFDNWDLLFTDNVEGLVSEGRAILRYKAKLVESLAKQATVEQFQGRQVPWVKCSLGQLVSDLGHELCKGYPFAVIEGSNNISLRSDEGGEDVSIIAKKLGGGGHKHAAGYPI